jgi:hypothetical protein
VNSLFTHKRQNERDHEYIHQRDLNKKIPAELHELIETESRQRPANPDEKEKEQRNLEEKGGNMEES